MAEDMELRQCRVCSGFYSITSFKQCPSCGSDSSYAESVGGDKKSKSKSIIDIFRNGKKAQKAEESIETIKNEKEESEVKKEAMSKAYITNQSETEENMSNIDEQYELKPITPDNEIMKKPDIENYSKKTANNEMKTVQIYNIKKEPVVGWLVCVRGACIGESFEIRGGNNKIGRSLQSDICIEDNTISREQAIIKFEPRKQIFYLIPIDNGKFMYIDGEEIMERITLEPYMHIEIGEKAEFVFVPFCGERFDWKEYVEE